MEQRKFTSGSLLFLNSTADVIHLQISKKAQVDAYFN